jgi:hypothetical protein
MREANKSDGKKNEAEKTTRVEGDLLIKKDTVYEGNLVVNGNILGDSDIEHKLKVIGDLTVRDIKARLEIDVSGKLSAGNILTKGNLTASEVHAEGDIEAWNITASKIHAKNMIGLLIMSTHMSAWDINAFFVLCETLKQKEGSKLVAYVVIRNRSRRDMPDWNSALSREEMCEMGKLTRRKIDSDIRDPKDT